MTNHYFIKDSEAELARLVEQERAISSLLGGLLPEHKTHQAAYVEPLQRILDVACGSGGWVIEMARTYPHLQVIGFDIDANMIDYARTQARVGRLENASFAVMDAHEPLDYPENFFDLVSSRWLSVIGRDAWPQMMSELLRVTRPGGFIRLMETEDVSVTTSPAFEKMSSLFLQAGTRSGFSFSSTGRTSGLPPMLPRFLRQAGFGHITQHALVLDWSMGTPAYTPMVFDFKLFFHLISPYLLKEAVTTEEELEQLHRKIAIELYEDDFCAWWTFYIVGAQKPLE
jgi:ubiquinone/menaquinone biosynthesis C-methylase UbiE